MSASFPDIRPVQLQAGGGRTGGREGGARAAKTSGPTTRARCLTVGSEHPFVHGPVPGDAWRGRASTNVQNAVSETDTVTEFGHGSCLSLCHGNRLCLRTITSRDATEALFLQWTIPRQRGTKTPLLDAIRSLRGQRRERGEDFGGVPGGVDRGKDLGDLTLAIDDEGHALRLAERERNAIRLRDDAVFVREEHEG